MSDFKNQREIFKWLLDGGKVQYVSGDIVFLEEDGKLNDISNFGHPEDWAKYIPEKPKVKWALYRFTRYSSDAIALDSVRAFKLGMEEKVDFWRLIPGSEFEDEE